jgi:hypothetical protein
MLGIAGIKNLALGMSEVGRTPLGDPGSTLIGLCLRRAIAARLISDGLGMNGQTNDCFTAGPLCEFGLLAHASQDPRRGAELCREWQLGDSQISATQVGTTKVRGVSW